MSDVGKLLRSKRLEKNYTLEFTAKLVGVSINYIAKLEKGESQNPSDENIVKLAFALDLDENDLFTSYGRIPLSIRRVLKDNPQLIKLISQLGNKKLSTEKKGVFFGLVMEEYKKLTEE
jgi:transcriptional regulator with XRE-family HTH domain